MKNFIVTGLMALFLIGGLFYYLYQKRGDSTQGKKSNIVNQENNQTSGNIFQNMTDMCSTLSKEQISQLIGRPIVKTIPITMKGLYSCQYYLNDAQAITINNDSLNVESQKKGHEFLGRKITTNQKIPINHFLVIQENGLINEIYLVLGSNNYVSINRTSTKTTTEEEIIEFAVKLANVLVGKTPLIKSEAISTPTVSPTTTNSTVPPPQETDFINSFINLIAENKPTDAVMMMTVKDDSEKQAWAVQFNAIKSIKALKIDQSMPESWTDTEHTYKATLDVVMSPESANAPIPYYGWENGRNLRWITIQKTDNAWKIKEIATGP